MNILWILEDALRPDHMGCYGYGKDTSPHCDRLAREGVRFETVVATASHTLPPIISMIMSQWASTHGVVDPDTFVQFKDGGWSDVRTPLHILRDQGYLMDGEMVMRWSPLGFERDTPGDEIEKYFEDHQDDKWFFYAEPYPTHLPYNPPPDYYQMFLDDGLKADADQQRRLEVVQSFLIVHPGDCISKLEAGEDDPLPDDDSDDAHKRTAAAVDLLPEDRSFINALYDGEVRVFDDMVGRWIDKLEQLGILDDTLIIITADHGEELMERGHVGHCSCNLKGTLHEESIRVPLIMRLPSKLPAGKVVTQPISQIDIMPTLFEMLGLPAPDFMQGSSLLGLVMDGSSDFREENFAQTSPAGWQALAGDDREIYCVRTAAWKLVMHTEAQRSSARYELFDLVNDPGETRDVFNDRSDITHKLLSKLKAYESCKSGRS